MRAGDVATIAVSHVVGERDRAIEIKRRGDGPGTIQVLNRCAVACAQTRYAQHVGTVHIAEAGQQVRGADGVRGVLGTGCQHSRGRADGRSVDWHNRGCGDSEQLAGRRTAALPVEHGIRQLHRAAVVERRGDGPGAVDVLRCRAVARAQPGHAQRAAIGIAEASQQVAGADRVVGIFQTIGQTRRCAACRGLVDVDAQVGDGRGCDEILNAQEILPLRLDGGDIASLGDIVVAVENLP